MHATAAAIIKRGWLDTSPEERGAQLTGIHAQASQLGTAAARRAGLELLTAVVEEFSPHTASPMGLSWCVAGAPSACMPGQGPGVAAASGGAARLEPYLSWGPKPAGAAWLPA